MSKNPKGVPVGGKKASLLWKNNGLFSAVVPAGDSMMGDTYQ